MLVSEFGADVEARNVRGRTPIFGAAQSGYCDIVRLLVTIYEANPLHIDIEGWTPVRRNTCNICTFLLLL
jgi:ankyrin repeat protein